MVSIKTQIFLALLEGPLDEGSSDDEPTPATAQKGGSPRNASAYTNDSKALTFTNLKESTIWKMRRVWAPALELKYPELEPPPARTFTSEQQVRIKSIFANIFVTVSLGQGHGGLLARLVLRPNASSGRETEMFADGHGRRNIT